MDIFGYHLPSFASAAAAFAAVYAAFAKFDADQSDENRKFVRDWLLAIKADDRQWSKFFTELFARAFGERHFSIKCFCRLAALSVSLYACIIIYAFVRFGPGTVHDDLSAVVESRGIILWLMCTIVIADYFSLWKTRFVLTNSKILNGGLAAVAIVFFDAVATLMSYSIILTMSQFMRVVTQAPDYSFFDLASKLPSDAIGDIEFAFSWSGFESPYRLQFLAPLFTSAWLWVYLIVAYGMRGINRVPPLLSVLSKVMDFQGHPVRTIGYVAATTSAAILGIFAIL